MTAYHGRFLQCMHAETVTLGWFALPDRWAVDGGYPAGACGCRGERGSGSRRLLLPLHVDSLLTPSGKQVVQQPEVREV